MQIYLDEVLTSTTLKGSFDVGAYVISDTSTYPQGYSNGTYGTYSTGDVWIVKDRGSIEGDLELVGGELLVATGGSDLTFDGIYLSGDADSYISTPDDPAHDLTADIVLVACVAPLDWASSGFNHLICRWNQTDDKRAYSLGLTDGAATLEFWWSADGINVNVETSDTLSMVTNGEAYYVAVVLDANNGASGYDVSFWTSPDDVTWTQLGTTITGGATTSIIGSGVTPLVMGNNAELDATPFNGMIHYGGIHSAKAFGSSGPTGNRVADFYSTGVTSTYTSALNNIWTIYGSNTVGSITWRKIFLTDIYDKIGFVKGEMKQMLDRVKRLEDA